MSTGSPHKIKLLFLIPNLECGGAERYTTILSNHINTGKFEITLAILNNEKPFYKINNPAIEITGLHIKRVRRSLFAIRKIIKEKQPDIIYSLSNHLNLYLAIYRRMLPKNILLVARESSIPSMNNQFAKFGNLYNWLMKKFYPQLDCIVCQSAYMQNDLIENFGIPQSKTVLIPNMVEVPPVGLSTALPIRDSAYTFKFITVARLSTEKGIERLLRSLAFLTIPFHYYVIGEGNNRADLESLSLKLNLKHKVFFTGRKDDPYEGFQDADLLLMGSLYEGSPNVLLEAGVWGIPVIAFDAPGGINEIIFDGENGFLVENGEEAGFAATIKKALQFKFDKTRIIATTKKRFPVGETVIMLEELFFNLIQAQLSRRPG